jgi:gliding motility-associated-like protein
LAYSSATCGVSGNIQLTRVGTPLDITPNCPSVPSACGGSGSYGIQEWLYQGILNLPPGCGTDWVLGWSQCCRNNAINTLNNPGSQNMFVGANLDNTTSPFCNSSPVFNNSPGSIVCVNQPLVYNHGVSDADGDSLFFSLGPCLQSLGGQVSYAGGFSGTTPLTTASGVTINPNTGSLTFTPTQQQVGVLCVNVREFRNGVLIGQINRDMQFTVIACSNTPPQASGVNGAPNTNPINFQTSICSNAPICFTINGTDPNSNNVTMSWNSEILGATFVVSNNGTTSPSAEFCWTPSQNNIGQNIFTVNVEDDACPIIGQGTYTYIIEVVPSPNVLNAGSNISICAGNATTLTATSSPAALSYTWSPSNSLSGNSGASVIATPLSTTTYEVLAAFPDGCDITNNVTVSIAPNPNVTVSPNNSFNCSGQNTVLTATSPTAISYNWSPGVQVGNSITVAPTATAIYTVTATDNLGCSNTANATITVAAPSGNVCNVLYVSPTGSPSGIGTTGSPMDLQTALEVGACNGTIIKMAIGDYITDTVINRVTSFITLEGGFNPALAWDKISTVGATRILRTATVSTSLVDGIEGATGTTPRVTAIEIIGQTGFRFQDLTIEVQDLPSIIAITPEAISTYGVILNNCDNYNLIRTQVISGNATLGRNGNGFTAPGGGFTGGNGGAGGSAGDGCSNPGPGANGIVGGGPSGGAAGNGTDVGGSSGCCGSSSPGNASGGANGANGTTFAAGDRPGTPAIAVVYFQPAGQSASAGDGSGGGGGGGGGGSRGGTVICVDCDGNNGGAGGRGGEGGQGGTGGRGGGSTYGLFIINNGTNGVIDDSNIGIGLAGIGGNGGSGSASIAGLNGATGGSGGGCVGGNPSGANGGAGGAGGNGGRGRDGANGESVSVRFVSGTALAINDNSYNLAVQPTIRMDDIACTETIMDFNQTNSAAWTFGPGSTPANATGTTVSSQYSSLGRKDINYGVNTYQGFANIILDSQVLPAFTTTAPFVAGQYRLCAGESADFISTNGGIGYQYVWDLGGGAVPNNYAGVGFASLNSIQFNTPGVYTITLQFETNCCGLSIPTTLNIYVEEQPNLVLNPIDATLCAGGSSPVVLSADDNINFGTINWSVSLGLNNSNTFNVLANPNDSITYNVTVTDSTGLCADFGQVSVNVVQIDLSISTTNTVCGPDGTASVIATGGSGNYTYLWDDPASQTTATATGLAVGNYNVTVIDTDEGCNATALAVVNPSSGALVGFISNSSPVSCSGNADGSLTVTIVGGLSPFDYDWTPAGGNTLNSAATTNTTSSLIGGTYNVSVTDAAGCTYSIDGFIAEPEALNITLDTLYNPTCIGATDGYISVQVDGGVGPYTLLWSDATPGNVLSNAGVGFYCVNVQDAAGCLDSVCFTLTAPLLTDSVFNTICQFEAYTLPSGITVFPSSDTSSIDSLVNSIGCGSIVSTFLVVNLIYSFNIDTILCASENFISPAGVSFIPASDTSFIDSLLTINNCDSLFNINIIVQQFTVVNIDTTICQGQSLTVNNVVYINAGAFNDTARYANTLCDSIQYVINLEIDSFIIETIDTILCQGQSIAVNGIDYNISGLYNDTASYASSGCDSIQYVINLRMDSFLIENIDTTICQGQSLIVNGVNYTIEGAYNDTAFYEASGCDSIQFVINLQIDSFIVENIDTTICEGQSLTVNGVNYTANGLYNDTAFFGTSGCDSIQYLINLQIDSFIVTDIDTTLCEGQSLTVNGINYNATGIYNDTASFTASGCDSIQYVINLQIDSVTVNDIDTLICVGETFTLNGASYNATGIYRDTSFHVPSGCIDNIFTLNLTVAPLPLVQATTNDSDSAACVNDLITVIGAGGPTNTYVWDNGITNNIAFNPTLGLSTYIVIGTDVNGCASNDTIQITGNQIYNETVNVTICEDEDYVLPDGTVVNTAGTYTINLSTVNLCDSIIVTILNVNAIGSFTPLIDIAVCDGLAQTLTINAQNIDTYQWFVNDGSGSQSLAGNPDYLGTGTSELSFNLDVSLHQNLYTVQMVDECGRPLSSSMTLEVYEPHLVLNPIEDTTFCLNEIDVVIVDYNGNNYVWNTGDLGPTILPETSGTFIVNFIENGTNCLMSDTIEVTLEDCIGNCVVLAPTGFSPNNSGNNDVFRVVTTCDEGFSFFLFSVYNRWGELIYTTDDWRSGWDGTYKGRQAEIGTYTYYVEYTKALTNKKESLKGNVTLIK